MNKKERIVVLENLLEGVRELNGEYQEGWDSVIKEGETLLNILREEVK